MNLANSIRSRKRALPVWSSTSTTALEVALLPTPKLENFPPALKGAASPPWRTLCSWRQLYKNRSSRKIDSRRLFSREKDFQKTFSLTENQFSQKTYLYTIGPCEGAKGGLGGRRGQGPHSGVGQAERRQGREAGEGRRRDLEDEDSSIISSDLGLFKFAWIFWPFVVLILDRSLGNEQVESNDS